MRLRDLARRLLSSRPMSTESGSAALDAGDRVFHDAYRGARDGVRAQVPILVVLPNELALHYRGERQLAPYSCPSFTAAKAAAHIAVALFALTGAQADPLHRNSGVARLLESIAAALDNELESDAKPLLVDIAALLTDCRRFAQAVCLERLTASCVLRSRATSGRKSCTSPSLPLLSRSLVCTRRRR